MSDEEKNIQEEEIQETQEPVEETTEPVEEEPTEQEEVVQESAEEPKKKKRNKKRWKDMTPEEKKKRRIRDAIISVSVIVLVAVILVVAFVVGLGGNKSNNKMITNFDPVGSNYTMGENLNIDEETGYYTFTTANDADFKVLQLTDVHIGAGVFSIRKDNWALNAVATLVQKIKPDLVIVTGDIAYPVLFQAGTVNNERSAVTFANLMEQLGVYWALAYGNHDTEAYALYTREEISERIYMDKETYPHCLFQEGPEDVDGCGNYIINVKNQLGLITQSFVMVDSHSYTDGDWLGLEWKYDNIHQNQIDWYEEQIIDLNTKNKAKYESLSAVDKAAYSLAIGEEATATALRFADPNSMTIKSSMYFHIPLTEYKDAYEDWIAADADSGKNFEYHFGFAGENKQVVYCGIHDDEVFETIQKLKSTTHVFCGHDHLNNFSITYYGKDGDKATDYGVTLTYGLSIDYLAYVGIVKKTEQRGGTIITVKPNGTLVLEQKKLIDVQ